MELAAKQLELLTEAFPERKRIGALWDELSADQFRAAERLILCSRRARLLRPTVRWKTPRSVANVYRRL
jgi:hypothetical protein